MSSFLLSFFLFSCSFGAIVEKPDFLEANQFRSGFRSDLSGVNRTSECERRYNNDGAWADKQFDAANNNLTENDPDFFLHTLFLTSVKTHFLQTISEIYRKCLNSTKLSVFPIQAGPQVYENLLRNNGTGNNTLYCDPISKSNQCSTGSECSPNGVNLSQRTRWIGWIRRIRRRLVLSYCRPIQVNADLDEMSFEKTWPLIQKIVGNPPGENSKNLEEVKVAGKGMKEGTSLNLGSQQMKQETGADLGTLQMAFQMQSINEAIGEKSKNNYAGRRRRSFGATFKRWFGKAIGFATAFAKIGKLVLGLFG